MSEKDFKVFLNGVELIEKGILELKEFRANKNYSIIKHATEFHPRAWDLMVKDKPFVVVAIDEPYFEEVYRLIRSHEMDAGRWTDFDERTYLKLIEDAKKPEVINFYKLRK